MRTKNRPLLLGRALDSVLAQTYGDWRLVVVNDGGEAGPVDALLAARRDAMAGRSRVIHNPASVGMEAASNIALRSEPADYAVMRSYSPYDNLRPAAYPAMYLRAGLNDSQVPYWEAAKYAARLRALKTDDEPVLVAINMDAGHGGASGRYDALAERAEVLAFMLAVWGLTAGAAP